MVKSKSSRLITKISKIFPKKRKNIYKENMNVYIHIGKKITKEKKTIK